MDFACAPFRDVFSRAGDAADIQRGAATHKEQDYYDTWRDGRGKIISVVVPADILDVEDAAFGSCSNLVSAMLSGTLEKWNILASGTAGAFNDCPALASVAIPGATALPHHIFAGSAPEIVFDGLPPATIWTDWAEDWGVAAGCQRMDASRWRADSCFTALAEIDDAASKPNYAAMLELTVWQDEFTSIGALP